ncbi:hypothetical protein LTR62_005822 [Meristemomyces frigidus]|uniref:Zn(2)-C6 fungal-type domain-containing protein n=1 Tax=Meristemomyces frigidus TaxID=1508187 RepID=A0AAN7YIZ1_9PEZI|nr:hypothetical protein LTR62_005822 [Meristemomyces frigidus]
METSPLPENAGKRKRTESETPLPPSAPPAKITKTANNASLSINYLHRHSHEDLPLLNKDDPLPNLLQLLSAYSNVLDRHESLASNLGARPLGPILIKRFERCFDAPPKVVASHHKGAANDPQTTGHHITWLEVIEFARAHPGQFTLSTYSEGKRVCQFYYPQKQLRVQISEEDFLFINSGRCQELIPPLPIWEDEEKEVGTCDVLEVKLKELTNIADIVAARTRQLSHRLKGRRAAILERRAEGGSGTPAKASAQQTTTAPGSGFVAVNTPGERTGGDVDMSVASLAGVRTELLRHFEGLPQNQNALQRPHSRHPSLATHPEAPTQISRHVEANDNVVDRASSTSSLSPVPAHVANDPLSYYVADSTPMHPSQTMASSSQKPPGSAASHNYHAPSKHNFSRPLPPALESSQPFRPLCQAHMDSLPRGHRVIPPCDRCRRLRMDCVKNLTSCAGCTKKHARCHWRDVTHEELGDLDHLMDSTEPDFDNHAHAAGNIYGTIGEQGRYDDGLDDSDDDESNPLEDLEALGEKEDQQEKEDEDGLRAARELSKQGLEVGGSLLETGAREEVQESDPGFARGLNGHEVVNGLPHVLDVSNVEEVSKVEESSIPPTTTTNGDVATITLPSNEAHSHSYPRPETTSTSEGVPLPLTSNQTDTLSPFFVEPPQIGRLESGAGITPLNDIAPTTSSVPLPVQAPATMTTTAEAVYSGGFHPVNGDSGANGGRS